MSATGEMLAMLQGINVADLIKTKLKHDAVTARVRLAVACYDAKKQAEAFGLSIEEYLTNNTKRQGRGQKLKLTLEAYNDYMRTRRPRKNQDN